MVDALVLGTSVNDVGVRVPSSAPSNGVDTMNLLFYFSLYFKCTLHKFGFNFQLCYNYCILLHKEELEMEQRNLEDLVNYLSEKCKKTFKKRTRNHEKTRFYNEVLQFLEEVNHLKRLIANFYISSIIFLYSFILNTFTFSFSLAISSIIFFVLSLDFKSTSVILFMLSSLP